MKFQVGLPVGSFRENLESEKVRCMWVGFAVNSLASMRS